MFIKSSDFSRKFLTHATDEGIANPRHFLPNDIVMPQNAVIHYLSESQQVTGIDNDHPLLITALNNIYCYHELKLQEILGSVTPVKINTPELIKRYHKTHLAIKPINNLDRSLSNNTNPIVINYSLLSKLYKYRENVLSLFYEWYNIRKTIWDMVYQIGNRREHFIIYKLPKTLPSIIELNKYAHNFTADGLVEFYTNDTLDLLELWRMFTLNIESVISVISEEVLSHIHFVFIEAGTVTFLRLDELVLLFEKHPTTTTLQLHKFLDKFYSIKSSISIKDSDIENINVDNTTVNNSKIISIINEHAEAGLMSSSEQKGLIKLSEKHKTILDPLGSGLTLDKMVVTKENTVFENKHLASKTDNIHDESMLKSSLKELDKHYIENVLHKDIVQTILSLHPAGIIVKDLNIKDKKTASTKTRTYAVQVQPINGPSSPINFTIPNFNADGTFLVNGTLYRFDKQKSQMPIVKSEPDTVDLSSYYGKTFVIRNNSSSANYSKWITKILTQKSLDKENKLITNLVFGTSRLTSVKLPRAYSAISESIVSFTLTKYENNAEIIFNFCFNFNKVNDLFSAHEIEKSNENGLILCGRLQDNSILGMDKEGIIYLIEEKSTNKLIELGTLPFLIDSDLEDGPIEYTEFSIMNKRIPVILAICYMYGLDKTLEKLNIPYTLSSTNVRVPYNYNTFRLKFKDIVYVIDISNIYNRILVGGFNSIKTDLPKYKGSSFNTQPSYSSILSRLGITNYHLREIKLMWDMFVDPITKGILIEMGEKTNFYDLLLRASSLLIDDHLSKDEDPVRYKGYERIAGMVYKQLIETVRAHRAQGAIASLGVSMNPNSVLIDILKDESIRLVEQSNPIHNLKEHEGYTHSGSGGRKSITMVKYTRGYNESDLGIISESTPDSSKVGISGYFSTNPNFTDVRGIPKKFNHEKDGPSQVLSTSAMVSPAITHDDWKRVQYVSIQNSHSVSCTGYDTMPYRTGYEEIIGSRVDELFVVCAIDDGVVTDVKPNELTVIYKNNIKKVYELGIKHGTVTGTTIPHNRVTDLKPGHRFNKGDALIFNDGFFKRSELNKEKVVLKFGVNARIAFIETANTTEDSAVISHELAKKLFTPVTTLHGLILDFDKVIHNLIKVGDKVNPDTILCTMENDLGDDILAKDEAAIIALNKITRNSPTAKVYGTVTEIDVVYYGKVEDMHFSLQQIVSEYDSKRAKRVKNFELDDAKTGKIDEPIRVSGRKLLPNQIAIKIYIDSDLDMNTGDKLKAGNMLKATVAEVASDVIYSEDNKPIDMLFSYQSLAHRTVGSPEIMGLANTCLQALSLKAGQLYRSLKLKNK